MLNKIARLITFAYFNIRSQESKVSLFVIRRYGKKVLIPHFKSADYRTAFKFFSHRFEKRSMSKRNGAQGVADGCGCLGCLYHCFQC